MSAIEDTAELRETLKSILDDHSTYYIVATKEAVVSGKQSDRDKVVKHNEQDEASLTALVDLILARDEKMRMELHQLTTAIDKVYESTRSHPHPTPERSEA